MPLINKTLINAAGEVRSQDFEQEEYRDIHKTGNFRFPEFTTVGITDGLVGYWPLNKDVKDYSGNNNHGVLTGATPTTGRAGGAYNFNYTNLDRITIDSVSFHNVTDAVTISAMVKSNNIDQPQNIVSRNGPYFLRINNSKIRCAIYAAGEWIFQEGSITLQSNTWYHLVMTYDGSRVKGYVNSVLDVDVAKNGALTVSDNPLFIGYTTVSGEQTAFNGIIDEVKIFNRALTAKEVRLEYNTMFNSEVQVEKNSGTLFAKDLINFE